MDCKVKELTEKISYPVVLADELKKELIDSILSKNPSQKEGDIFRNPRGLGGSYAPMHYSLLVNKFEFRWNELFIYT